MTLSLTCKACGTVLTAADEDELAVLGQRHAQAHGHGPDRPLSRAHVLARIRRHNPPAPSPPAPSPPAPETPAPQTPAP